MFTQKNGYGCGLYALANIFQDKSLITEKRLNDSINGNHTMQISQWIWEYGKELFLEPFYFNSNGKRLPKWVCNMRPSGDNVFSIPIFIDVQQTRKSKTHFIAAEITINGDLFVMDSLKTDPYLSTLTEFNKSNYRTFGVWYLRHYYEDGYFMRFSK